MRKIGEIDHGMEAKFFKERLLDKALRFPLGAHHCFLAFHDFRDWPIYVDKAILKSGGQAREKLRKDFYDFPINAPEKIVTLLSLPKLSRILPLKISARIVFVHVRLAIKIHRLSGSPKHLHCKRGAGAREPRYNRDHMAVSFLSGESTNGHGTIMGVSDGP